MKTLNLKGQSLQCIEELPAGALLDIAEAAEAVGNLKMYAAFRRILNACVLPSEHEKLEALLYDTSDVLPIDALDNAIGDLIASYSGHPIERPSASPAGSPPIEPVSRVVSFSKGTAETPPQSSRAGARSVS